MMLRWRCFDWAFRVAVGLICGVGRVGLAEVVRAMLVPACIALMWLFAATL